MIRPANRATIPTASRDVRPVGYLERDRHSASRDCSRCGYRFKTHYARPLTECADCRDLAAWDEQAPMRALAVEMFAEGMTQTAIGKELGVGRSTVGRWVKAEAGVA